MSDRLRQDGKTKKLPLTAYLGIDGKLHSIRKAAPGGQQVTGSKSFVNEGAISNFDPFTGCLPYTTLWTLPRRNSSA